MTVIEQLLMVLGANMLNFSQWVKIDYVLQSCSGGSDRVMGEKLDCPSGNLKLVTWIYRVCNTCEESKKKLKMQSCVLVMFLSY